MNRFRDKGKLLVNLLMRGMEPEPGRAEVIAVVPAPKGCTKTKLSRGRSCNFLIESASKFLKPILGKRAPFP